MYLKSQLSSALVSPTSYCKVVYDPGMSISRIIKFLDDPFEPRLPSAAIRFVKAWFWNTVTNYYGV